MAATIRLACNHLPRLRPHHHFTAIRSSSSPTTSTLTTPLTTPLLTPILPTPQAEKARLAKQEQAKKDMAMAAALKDAKGAVAASLGGVCNILADGKGESAAAKRFHRRDELKLLVQDADEIKRLSAYQWQNMSCSGLTPAELRCIFYHLVYGIGTAVRCDAPLGPAADRPSARPTPPPPDPPAPPSLCSRAPPRSLSTICARRSAAAISHPPSSQPSAPRRRGQPSVPPTPNPAPSPRRRRRRPRRRRSPAAAGPPPPPMRAPPPPPPPGRPPPPLLPPPAAGGGGGAAAAPPAGTQDQLFAAIRAARDARGARAADGGGRDRVRRPSRGEGEAARSEEARPEAQAPPPPP